MEPSKSSKLTDIGYPRSPRPSSQAPTGPAGALGRELRSGLYGGSGFLAAYDLKGQHLGNFVGHESEVWAVTPSPDGRLLVSSSADQTVRLWNLRTRELIATLFTGTDGEWVMWTAQGYYTGSPGADKIVGWRSRSGPGLRRC